MKTLTNPRTTISADGKTATIVADISEIEHDPRFVQRVTVGYLNPANIRHPRHVQISQDAIFIKGGGCGFAMTHDFAVSVAAKIEPKTSYAPIFKKTETPFTVDISSELNPDLQWEVCEGLSAGKIHQPKENWAKIDGQTTESLDPSKVKSGQWIRCVASSEAGSMASKPVQVK